MEKSQQNPESKGKKIANLKNNDDFTQNTSVKPMQAREKNSKKKGAACDYPKILRPFPPSREMILIRGNFSSKFAPKKKRH